MPMLYHASPQKNLRVIKPKRTLSNNKYIGDYVFATSNLKLAAMYLAAKGRAALMNVEIEPFYIAICDDQKEYLKNDTGGAIYTVPAGTFEKTPQAGLENSEQVSRVAVSPIDKKVYSSSLDAVKGMKIDIYFISKSEFEKLVGAKDEKKILALLRPFSKAGD